MGTHSTSAAARLAAVFGGLLLVASASVGLAADAGSGATAPSAGGEQRALEQQLNAATLELYALETQLGQARAALQSLSAQRASVARERASARARLTIARGALRLSQERLAQLLRELYQQTASADPLAIILGAGSLEEALTGLDSLSRAAGENTRIVDQARTARRRLKGLDARLAAKDAALRRLTAAAQARATELEAAAAARQGYLAGLRRRQGLNARRIAAIQTEAKAAQVRTETITAEASTALPSVAPPAAAEAVAVAPEPEAPSPGGRTLTVSATGYALRGRTATGVYTGPGVVAVDPSVIPLGTRMTIPGYGEGIAADTGGAVQGNVIDLWFPTVDQALQWGRRTVTIVIR